MMRTLLILLFVSLASAFHNIIKNDPELIKIAEDCGVETSVDITVFEPEKKTDIMKLFEEKKYRCYARCMVIKTGLASEKSEANKENIKKRFDIKDDHPVFKSITTCSEKVKAEDNCDQVFQLLMCIEDDLHH